MPTLINNAENALLLQCKLDILRSENIDLAFRHFFLPGFIHILGEMSAAKKVRVFFGNNSERIDPAEVLDRHARLQPAIQVQQAELLAGRQAMTQRVANLSLSIRRSIGSMMQTPDDERVVKNLLDLMEKGVLDVRVNVRERIDGSLLIADFGKNRGASTYGGGNPLTPELNTSSQINLRFGEEEAAPRGELKNRFDEWWSEALPFKEKLTAELKNCWATQATTPYLLYLLVLYRLVADRLKETLPEKPIEHLEGFPTLADFQQVAVQQALTILREYNGVFVADVVGLGKTYIGSAILKHLQLQGQRATIFCPPALVEMWEEFNHRYGLAAVVVSTGKLLAQNGVNLNEPKYQTSDRQIVLIDESHRFRNRNTDRFRILSKYTQGRRCLLLTATPYSLHPRDIETQIRLFSDDDLDLGLNPPRLSDFFRKIENNQASLIEVLRPLLIRRTRKHIQKHYPDAKITIELPDGTKLEQPLKFPKRDAPETVRYDVEGVYGEGLYDSIVRKLGATTQWEFDRHVPPTTRRGELSYARYGLQGYVLPEYVLKDPYRDLRQSGYSVRGFVHTLLFKRLESSVEAFRSTVKTILKVHEGFILALKNGYIPAGDAGRRILYERSWDDDGELLQALEDMNGRYSPEAFDVKRLENDLTNDCEVLQSISEQLEPITPEVDSKLETLRGFLTQHKGAKILVFTQYETTARYLYENLKEMPRITWLSGQHRGSGKGFMNTVARFAPKANPLFVEQNAEPIDILIATDVLSEGLNLQDCSHVINYDIHWNPVRLIQRIGRVDRIGSEADHIRLFNFLPERNVEKVLKLEEILRHRIAEIHNFIGEDNAILHPDEKLNEKDLYAIYTQSLDEAEEDPSSLALDFTEIEERMRQLQREQPDLFQDLQNLPAGVRAARKAKGNKEGAFLYFAAGNYEEIYLVDRHGSIKTTQLEKVLEAIECKPDENSMPLPENHSRVVSEALKRFELEAAKRKTDKNTGSRLSPGQKYAVRNVLSLLKNEVGEDKKAVLFKIERALRSNLPDGVLRELNVIRRLGLIDEPFRQRLLQIYHDLDLERYSNKQEDFAPSAIARIICSEALVSE